LTAGFTAVDTANQRKHYYEEGVGLGIQRFLEKSGSERQDLFLQTKFTYARGQDHRKPYNENDSFTQQVQDSFAKSLEHLQTNYIDSFVLHGPYDGQGIGDEDLETWAAMETLLQDQRARHLGVSNISPSQLNELCARVRRKPYFVQNRCFAQLGWDQQIREICLNEGIHYQGFSLLTANTRELSSPRVLQIAQKYQKTVAQVVFRFCGHLNMICLTGTSNPQHMQQDLAIDDFELTPDEINTLETIGL
jgi:diketogulonate reductase-like aldo/keto reductase